ncbi:MAG: hypothetical protein LBK99_08355 [Opitutaceae bacterium]|jgi:hypothetical protein|nr:hypothetical protein [Opitutaceae bacterium]
MNTGKCPHCGIIITQAKTENVTIGVYPDKQWHGISYVCPNPSCQKVISMQIDPVALMNDTVEKTVARLRS